MVESVKSMVIAIAPMAQPLTRVLVEHLVPMVKSVNQMVTAPVQMAKYLKWMLVANLA